jgi:peptide/nickel transport system ATP-binding protein
MEGRGRLAYRKEVQAIFQDPYEVYNPFYRVQHIFDMAMRHFPWRTPKRKRGTDRRCAQAGGPARGRDPGEIPAPAIRRAAPAHHGGARYMLQPRLIVADEPVSAVDASLRAMILDIMLRLRDEHGISFLYITHDLSTAYQIGDEMVILFQGVVAERGHTVEIIENPKHPYVQELIASIPAPNPKRKWDTDIKLPPEDATRLQRTRGCHFYARCPARMDRCKTEMPPLYSVGGNGHQASCFLYETVGVQTPGG